MPAAIPLIVYAGSYALGATAATASFWAIASSIAVSKIEQKKAKRKARDEYIDSLSDRLELIRSGISAHKYVVGTCRVTGTLLYADSVGYELRYLDSINALAANKCQLIAHYLNEERVEIADFPGQFYSWIDKRVDYEERFTITGPTATVTLSHVPITGTLGGPVQVWRGTSLQHKSSLASTVAGSDLTITGPSGTYEVLIQYKGADDPNIDTVFLDGDKDQAAHSWGDLATPLWTAAHRARGICCLRTRYIWDEGKFGARGAPQHGAVLKGMGAPDHPFYDPRDDSNPAYTTNPAILAAWWMTLPRRMGGMGIPSDWIDWGSVADAANICDEAVYVKKLDGTGYEYIKRYECHAYLSTDASPIENLNIILSSMAGQRAFTAGKYKLFAGAFRTATFTITDADLCGTREMQIATGGDLSGVPNVVTATYSNANDHWRDSSPKPVVNQAYIDLDGHETPLELELPATTDERQANYLMGIALESARPAVSLVLPVLGIGEDISIGQTGQLNLSQLGVFSGRTFMVAGRIDRLDGTFDLRLREIRTQTYALDPESWTPKDPVPVSNASHLWQVTAPTGFAVAQISPQLLPDFTAVSRVSLSWDAPAQAYVATSGYFELRYRRVGYSWITTPEVRGDETSTTITAVLEANDWYQFQIRAVNGIGQTSNWVDVYQQITAVDSSATTGWAIDGEGKPAGVRAINNIADRSQINFAGTALRIASTPVAGVAYGLPAIPIDDASSYVLTIRHRSSVPCADGLYLRLTERSSALAAGKTHIAAAGPPLGEAVCDINTSLVDLVENGAMPGATLITQQFVYTPTAGTKYATFAAYNWFPTVAGVSYDIEWVRLTKQGSNVNLLSQAGEPGKDGADGAGTFTLVEVGNMNILSPTSAFKRSASNWDGKVRSDLGFIAGAVASMTANAGISSGVGLTTDPSVDASYASVDYWLHGSLGTGYYVYRNAALVAGPIGTIVTGDRMVVVSDNLRVRYYVNGTVIYSHPVNTPGELLYGVWNVYDAGGVISGLSFSASGSAGNDGTPGTPGLNNATVILYQRAVSAPAVPSASVVYTFATGATTGVNNGWSRALPAGTDPLWVTAATASGTGATDNIATAEWSAPAIMTGAGLNSASVYLYKRGPSAPAVPAATLTYTFITGVLAGGSLDGWSQTIPSGTDPLYQTTATAIAVGSTDTIANSEWAAAQLISADGRMLVARGQCEVSASSIRKQGGASAWDSDVYSLIGYAVAHIRFKAGQADSHLMMGFSANPTVDQSYTSIERAFYLDFAGNLHIYENGAPIGSYGTYTPQTVLDIVIDGANCMYYKDGVLLHTTGTTGTKYLDSSFYTPGAAINYLVYGPGTAAGQVDTAQVGDGAITTEWSAYDATGVGYNNFA